jgi:hypothetical protein
VHVGCPSAARKPRCTCTFIPIKYVSDLGIGPYIYTPVLYIPYTRAIHTLVLYIPYTRALHTLVFYIPYTRAILVLYIPYTRVIHTLLQTSQSRLDLAQFPQNTSKHAPVQQIERCHCHPGGNCVDGAQSAIWRGDGGGGPAARASARRSRGTSALPTPPQPEPQSEKLVKVRASRVSNDTYSSTEVSNLTLGKKWRAVLHIGSAPRTLSLI